MKKTIALIMTAMLLLCSCNIKNTDKTEETNNEERIILAGEPEAIDKQLIGKWIDVETEKIFEYTIDGYYYEWVNENFTYEKTRYIANGGKIYYYLDSERPDTNFGVAYEFAENGNLIIAGEIEYKPMDIKTSSEEID